MFSNDNKYMAEQNLSLFEKLTIEDPAKVVHYLAHLANQIKGLDNPFSAQYQRIRAELDGDIGSLDKAASRERQLTDKFLGIAGPFFEEHVVLGSYSTDGQSRAIWDVLEPRSR